MRYELCDVKISVSEVNHYTLREEEEERDEALVRYGMTVGIHRRLEPITDALYNATVQARPNTTSFLLATMSTQPSQVSLLRSHRSFKRSSR